MAMLVDEGKMRWDDQVRRYVPSFHLADPLADAEVTLRDLVCHRTGLRGHDLLWYHAAWGQDEIIRKIGLVPLDKPFRSAFQYQGIMFMVAGRAVAEASHQNWTDFVRQRIFEPLGMKTATFTSTAAEQNPDHAGPHRRSATGQIESMPRYKMDTPDPANSIHASARDLTRWLLFQLGDGTFDGKRLVSSAALDETHTPQMLIRMEGPARAMNPDTVQMSYGMGWVIQDYHGHRLLSHAGAIDGFRSHLAFLPEDRLGIVLLNNLNDTRMSLALSNQIIDLLLGLPRRDWNACVQEQVKKEEEAARQRVRDALARRQPGTKPSRELVAYVGSYDDPAYGRAKVSLEDGQLVLRWSSLTCPLEHFHFDVFTVQNEVLRYPQVQFTLDRNGDVAALKELDTLKVEFKKVPAQAGDK
jgi:CubicO group peptidase (beta-lactamase class C family)